MDVRSKPPKGLLIDGGGGRGQLPGEGKMLVENTVNSVRTKRKPILLTGRLSGGYDQTSSILHGLGCPKKSSITTPWLAACGFQINRQ